MKVLMSLERIGDDGAEALRHYEAAVFVPSSTWLKARQAGAPSIMPAIRAMREDGGLGRWLRYRRDYSSANGTGSRGVMAVYELEMGHYYWVRERTSWKNSREYFICAGRAGIREVEREEAVEWARERLAWM